MKKKTLIIGLTGGIGMGKSTAADILREIGLPVYCADRSVHTLLGKNGKAVEKVAKLFPDALKQGAIDRKAVGKAIFHEPEKLKRLENILHPLVHAIEAKFVAAARKKKARAVVLDIPLLFEVGREKNCDFTLCVTAPKAVQRARVMARPGMTEAKFRAILKKQMPDAEKRKKADYMVQTGKSRKDTERQLRKILAQNGLNGL